MSSKEYPSCKICETMCYTEQMVEGHCVPCTRKLVKQLRVQVRKLEGQLRTLKSRRFR